jgi:hypothetical protein
MRQVMGGICVCDECIGGIVVFYVLNSPIKTLCPHCVGLIQNIEKCNYCDLPINVSKVV